MMNFSKQLFQHGACFIACLLFLLFIRCHNQSKEESATTACTNIESHYLNQLQSSIQWLDSLAATNQPKKIKGYYLRAREAFKRAEPLLAFHDVNNYSFLNGPNILSIHEEDKTDIKVLKPQSFQTVEETIYADSIDVSSLHQTVGVLRSRLHLLSENTDISHFQDHHILWLIRNTISRVALTGLTGFDSPVLTQSLKEAIYNYETIAQYFKFSKHHFHDDQLFQRWMDEIQATIDVLQRGEFDTFNRYQFIKNHSHKQLGLWNETVEDWEVSFPFTLAMNHNINSFFTDSTFNKAFYTEMSYKESPQKARLGKKLFYDNRLSSSKELSCGSCHKPELAFTDGKTVSPQQKRNSPTLTYAALQQEQFYDNRLGGLEGQIVAVVNNETEFHTNLENITKVVKRDEEYLATFKELYGEVNDYFIRNAIAEYIRTLTPFQSSFDLAINDQGEELTDQEINGFNLFMGKASCGTCHFAPVFNGTVPPNFTNTEMEVLGVPEEAVWENATVDCDLGRWDVYQTEERKFFFKTPTVRNIEKTAPYMHNGVYKTLEDVMTFYNLGGGAGIGIHLPNQTLPPEPLNLTDQEINDIIAFMRSLTDKNISEY